MRSAVDLQIPGGEPFSFELKFASTNANCIESGFASTNPETTLGRRMSISPTCRVPQDSYIMKYRDAALDCGLFGVLSSPGGDGIFGYTSQSRLSQQLRKPRIGQARICLCKLQRKHLALILGFRKLLRQPRLRRVPKNPIAAKATNSTPKSTAIQRGVPVFS